MKNVDIQQEAISGVNIVPVIDVTLVLLVVLLVISPVMNQPNLPVNLPEAMTKESKDQNVTVSMAADGRVSVDTEIVDINNLPQKLIYKLKGHEDAVVIVRADRNMPYGNVETLIRTVNRYAGKRAVAIATQQRSAKLTPDK